jgi:hypothetical protein
MANDILYKCRNLSTVAKLEPSSLLATHESNEHARVEPRQRHLAHLLAVGGTQRGQAVCAREVRRLRGREMPAYGRESSERLVACGGREEGGYTKSSSVIDAYLCPCPCLETISNSSSLRVRIPPGSWTATHARLGAE